MKIEDEIKQKKFSNPYQKMMVNILFTSNWLSLKSQQSLKKHGLSIQQYNILRILRGQKGQAISVNALIDRMLDKMSNASRLVEKLRQKGYVERKVCPTDRRQVDVIITDKGIAFLDDVDPDLASIETELKALTEEEAEQLNDLLDKLRS